MTENSKEKTLPKETKEQKEKEKRRTWKKTTELGIIVASLDVIIVVVGVYLYNINSDNNLGWTVAAVGIVTFFGMLIVSSYHKRDSPEGDKGTMRDALTASLISAYFVVLTYSLSVKIESSTPVNSLLSSFSSVIIIVIGFYFGSKGAVEIYKHKEAIAKSQKPKSE